MSCSPSRKRNSLENINSSPPPWITWFGQYDPHPFWCKWFGEQAPPRLNVTLQRDVSPSVSALFVCCFDVTNLVHSFLIDLPHVEKCAIVRSCGLVFMMSSSPYPCFGALTDAGLLNVRSPSRSIFTCDCAVTKIRYIVVGANGVSCAIINS